MPRRPKFEPYKDKATGKWVVVTPASMAADGRLSREYLESDAVAKKQAQKLSAQYHRGIRNAAVDPLLARQAEEAARILKEFGVSIVDAAKDYALRMKAAGTNRTFGEQYSAFMEANEMEWSDRYRADMEKLGEKLPGSFQRRRVATIAEAEIEKAVRTWSTGRTEVAKWARMVAAVVAGRTKKSKGKAPSLLSKDQVRNMLKGCDGVAEKRAVALLLYAGIRPDARSGEITKLLWEDVGAGDVTVRAVVAKTGHERIIPIRPKLARILKGHPKSGPVVPAQWKRRIQRIRKAAGLGVGHQDATRHTFASNHLVAYGEASTQAAMGHAANSRTLFSHYRQAVTETQAKDYFK